MISSYFWYTLNQYRLAQGHARLMFREEVTVMDAVVVVTLMESSMQSAALISADNCWHASFPEDVMSEYRRQSNCLHYQQHFFVIIKYYFLVELVLRRLDLEDILAAEREHLDELASLPKNCDINPFAFHKFDNRGTHIAQTQRILANIQRQNIERSQSFEIRTNDCGTKRKQSHTGRAKSSKRVRLGQEESYSRSSSSETNSYESTDDCRDHNLTEFSTDKVNEKNESSEELPSILGSPVVCSTQINQTEKGSKRTVNPKLSIFRFSREEDSEDDTIFDL